VNVENVPNIVGEKIDMAGHMAGQGSFSPPMYCGGHLLNVELSCVRCGIIVAVVNHVLVAAGDKHHTSGSAAHQAALAVEDCLAYFLGHAFSRQRSTKGFDRILTRFSKFIS